jgi:hypothetical protein
VLAGKQGWHAIMGSVVHFRFRSALKADKVEFDGHFVSVGELKRLIAIKKKLGEEAASELVLSHAQTGVDYTDDGVQLSKNSSVLVKRVPGANKPKLNSRAAAAAQPVALPQAHDYGLSDAPVQIPAVPAAAADASGNIADLAASALAKFEQAAPVLPEAAGAAAEPAWQALHGGAGRGRGRGRGMMPGRGAAPPPNYQCHICGQYDHYKEHCPHRHDPTFQEVKKVRLPAGVPMNMLSHNAEGGLLLPNGEVGALMPQGNKFAEAMNAMPTARQAAQQQEQVPQLTDGRAGQQQAQQEAPLALPAPDSMQQQMPTAQVQQQQPEQHVQKEQSAPRRSSPGLFDDEDDAVMVPEAGLSLGFGLAGARPRPQQQPAAMTTEQATHQLAVMKALMAPELRRLLTNLPLDFLTQVFSPEEPLPRAQFQAVQQYFREQAAVHAASAAAKSGVSEPSRKRSSRSRSRSRRGRDGSPSRDDRRSRRRRSRSRSR